MCVSVDDQSILAEIPRAGASTGVFVEPASACTLAGLRKAIREHIITPPVREGGEEKGDGIVTVVAIMTGTGLKDVPASEKAILAQTTTSQEEGAEKKPVFERGSAVKIPISLQAVEEIVKGKTF